MNAKPAVISAVEIPAAVYDELERRITAAMRGQLFDDWSKLYATGKSIEYGGLQLLRSATAQVLR